MSNNQKKGQKFWKYYFFLLGIGLILIFISDVFSRNYVNLGYGSIGFILILPLFLSKNVFYHKIISSVVIFIIIFLSLILAYTYLYQPTIVYSYEYIASTGFLFIYMILFVYYYPRKWKGFYQPIK